MRSPKRLKRSRRRNGEASRFFWGGRPGPAQPARRCEADFMSLAGLRLPLMPPSRARRVCLLLGGGVALSWNSSRRYRQVIAGCGIPWKIKAGFSSRAPMRRYLLSCPTHCPTTDHCSWRIRKPVSFHTQTPCRCGARCCEYTQCAPLGRF